jgi:hypothetical protein
VLFSQKQDQETKDSVLFFVPENADAAAHYIGETAGVRHILTPRERGVRPVPVRSIQSGAIVTIYAPKIYMARA